MNPEVSDSIRRRLAYLEEHGSALVIDADTHITDTGALRGAVADRYAEAGYDYYHGRPISAEDLVAEMEMAGVDMALCWQNPATTPYGDDLEANFQALLEANAYVAESALRYPARIVPGGWTDPKALGLEGALRLTEILVREFGMLFVKMNPAQNRFPIDSADVRAVVARIAELGAIPAFHFGADTTYTPADGLEALAKAFPDTAILAIHMGGGGAAYVDADPTYLRARELGLEYPNIRYALSAKRDTHIETALIRYSLAGPPFSSHLYCASDAPYGRMTWNFGGFRAMLAGLVDGRDHPDPRVRENPQAFTPGRAQAFLGGNFASFLVENYRPFLERRQML